MPTEVVRGLSLRTTKPKWGCVSILMDTTTLGLEPMYYSIEARNKAILEAIKNFVPPPGYWEKVQADAKAYDEYMDNPNHPGDCYCYRCMKEFCS